MGDWWIIGDNAGLGCPSSDEFLAGWDNGDWYASDVERLRLTAGFCGSRVAWAGAPPSFKPPVSVESRLSVCLYIR